MTFWPATVRGISATVFFSGMPREAAGPVAETTTPTLMSARAEPQTVARVAASRPSFVKRFMSVSLC
ncbi:MAG: hypothetical protein GAK34_02703 [Delftia tsuruhatensis]|nr:MAG: hypothetical protein GAK34_02703 [Delftia tsuruhatensis]